MQIRARLKTKYFGFKRSSRSVKTGTGSSWSPRKTRTLYTFDIKCPLERIGTPFSCNSITANMNNRGRRRGTTKRNTRQRNGKSGGRADRGPNGIIHSVPNTLTRFKPICYGFPDRLVTTLRYYELDNFQSVAGVPAQVGFRWNSIFDPNYSAGGHQPMYRDTYASIYDHYSVISARATIKFVSQNDAANSVVTAVTDDDTSPSTTFTTVAEQNHGWNALLGHADGAGSTATVVLNWDCKEILGIDPYTSQAYKTAMGSNPSEESLLWLSNFSLFGTTVTVAYSVMIEYTVLFSELQTPSSS